MNFLKNLYNDDEISVISNIDLKSIEQEDAYIPNRNLLLLSIAQSFFNPDIIYINGVRDDRVSDNTFTFRTFASQILSESVGREIQIKSVFHSTEKSKAVEEFCENTDTQQHLKLLTDTYSCYNKDLYIEENLPVFRKNDSVSNNCNEYNQTATVNIHGCLECLACYRRFCALTFANLYVPFYNFSISKEYHNKKLSNVDFPNRIKSINNYHNFLTWFGCD